MLYLSDHFPNFLICDKTEIDTYSETTNIFKRYINEDSINNFNEMLNLASWENFHKITCPNKAYDSFLELITSFYEAAFPKVKIKIKTKNLLSPWITKGLLKSSKRKQKLYDKFLKHKTEINETNYKNYKNLFESIKFKSKKNYYAQLILKYQNNIKKTWQAIKEITGKTGLKNDKLPRTII